LSRRAWLGGCASVAATLVAARATAGDKTPSRWLAAGRFRTPVFERAATAPGPVVLVLAGLHGNETAPPHAARALLELALVAGRLVVVPEVNRPALAARGRHTPGARLADVNRNFPTAARAEPRDELSAAVWGEITQLRPDWVLDLHEGWGYSASSRSMGSSVVVAPEPSGRAEAMATHVLAAVNGTVDQPNRRFTRIGPGPEGSVARAVAERLGTPALVHETTWTEPMPLRIRKQLVMAGAVLERLGLVVG
jgi:hypothetical protein